MKQQILFAKDGKVSISNPYPELIELIKLSKGRYKLKYKQAM